jgi:hypothetical protein
MKHMNRVGNHIPDEYRPSLEGGYSFQDGLSNQVMARLLPQSIDKPVSEKHIGFWIMVLAMALGFAAWLIAEALT